MNAPALNFDDPLAACLAVTARLHGQPVSAEALTAGLPLEEGRLTQMALPTILRIEFERSLANYGFYF